jgi:hypothetical protein
MDYTQPPPSDEELPPPIDEELLPPADEPLPTYEARRTASRLPTEHAFHLVKADGHRWLTLFLMSSAAASTTPPYFFGGDRVEGHVALDLKEPATFRSIDVTVRQPSPTSSIHINVCV